MFSMSRQLVNRFQAIFGTQRKDEVCDVVTHKKFMTDNIYVKWCGKRSQKKIEDSQFKLQCSVEKLCDHGALLLSKTMYSIIIYV